MWCANEEVVWYKTDIDVVRVLHYVDDFISRELNTYTPDQTIHQTSVHEDPGFYVVLLVKRVSASSGASLARCSGAFLERTTKTEILSSPAATA